MIVALATALRVVLLVRANWLLDGDEATMALLGRHILTLHERPIFFPGQAYMGAWQAYLCAALFWALGESREVAKLPPLLGSSAFMVTLALLARRLYGRGTSLLAALLAGLPSLYLLSSTLKLSYPLLDVMSLGNLTLLLAIECTDRPLLPRNVARPALTLGLLVGAGFWLHAAIAVYAAPAGLLVLLRWRRLAFWPGAPTAMLGFLVGAAPVWQFARSHDYTTIDYLRGNDSDTAARDYSAIAEHLVRTIVPQVAGLRLPWQPTPWPVQALVAIPTLAAILWLMWRCRTGPRAWLTLQPQQAPPECLVALFGATVLAAYLLSRFSVYAILFPNIDATGRYLAPLGTFLPLTLAGAAGAAWRARPTGRVVAAVGVAMLLLGTAVPYWTSNSDQIWQSPYYRHLPESNTALIQELDALDVDAVWIDHWAGKPLMFDTHERIAAADYVDLRVTHGIDRMHTDSERVFTDDRPAFVFVTDAPSTPLEAELTKRGVPYTARAAGGYRIVLPAFRVDPATVVDALLAPL